MTYQGMYGIIVIEEYNQGMKLVDATRFDLHKTA